MLGFGSALLRNLLVLVVASPLLLLVSGRLPGLDRFWPLIPLIAFVPQIAIGLLVLLVVALLLRARWAAVVLAVGLAVMAGALAPRAIGGGDAAGGGSADGAAVDDRTLTILTANLKLSDASVQDLARLIRRVRPDVITLQEATPWFHERLRAAGATRRYPYESDHTAWGSSGYLTLSRSELHEAALSGVGSGSAGREDWPEMRVAGTPVILRNIHPAPPLTPHATSSWRTTLANIPGPEGQVRVIAGDFNATLDHHDLRAVLARGYRDAGAETGNGLKWTWTAGFIRRLVIDHVLVPPGVGVSDYRVFDLPGSDHNAVAVTLHLPK